MNPRIATGRHRRGARGPFQGAKGDIVMSKSRPILFNDAMVRAILAGTKTQTRRPLSRRLAAEVGFIGGSGEQHDPHAWGFGDIDGCWHVLGRDAEPWFGDGMTNGSYRIQCEVGEIGDTLWVRECFAKIWPDEDHVPDEECNVEYRADGDAKRLPGCWPREMRYDTLCPRWIPSIHMPRWASRLTLRVTDVRVERVQDITESDAFAEGVSGWARDERCETARDGFRVLWNEVYGTWDANPWVWAVTFEVVR